jgi:hypothetical protein
MSNSPKPPQYHLPGTPQSNSTTLEDTSQTQSNSTIREDTNQKYTNHVPNNQPQRDDQDGIPLRPLRLHQTAPVQTQESPRVDPPDLNNDDIDMDEASPALSSTDTEVAQPASPSAVQDAETSGEALSATASHDGRIKPKPSGLKRWFEHRNWLPTIMLPTITCPSFITRSLHRIGQWWRGHRYLNLWWWEAVCCIIALGALIAIVATIRIYESKPLPHFRYGLSVNAIIAAYTVIFKAAAGLVLAEGISHLKWIAVAQPQALSTFVAHDNASRGPLGALKLLWKNQYKSGKMHFLPFISSLGALITVLILLLDPFSQQIIRTYECKRLVTGENSTIARTNVYTEVRNSAHGMW